MRARLTGLLDASRVVSVCGDTPAVLAGMGDFSWMQHTPSYDRKALQQQQKIPGSGASDLFRLTFRICTVSGFIMIFFLHRGVPFLLK